jgi:uncharacterized protein (DUF1330 family)
MSFTNLPSTIKSPYVYYIAEFDLKNAQAMKPYAENVVKTAEAHGGVYLVRGGPAAVLEGEPPKRIVVIRFRDMQAARGWYDSAEYTAIRPYRQQAGETRNFLVEGVE